MSGRMLLAAALVALWLAVPSMADVRAGLTAYRVTMVLYPGDEGTAVAKRLAATYRGTLETGVVDDGSFVIVLSDSAADLMRRDPAVERLEATAVVPGPASTAVAAAWKLGDYLYDGSGNIRKIGTEFFAYDADNRLIVSAETAQAPAVNHEQTYSYDNFGNLTSITTAGAGQTTLGVSTATNRVTTVTAAGGASVSPQYDGAGNMVGHGTATYTYDALNMMTKSVVDGVSRHYADSPGDERIATFEATTGGTRSDWTIRDQAGQILRRYSKETTGEWKWQEDYIYRGSHMLAAEVPDTARTRHFHVDHLGTPRLITGNGGAELSRHNYHPFGVEIAAPSTSSTAASREKKQFTGHERDAESLDYMHARFYAPYMGRFLSVDPVLDVKRALKQPQAWNRYTYVVNSPINRIDPDGRVDQNWDGGAAQQLFPDDRAAQLAFDQDVAEKTAISAGVTLAAAFGGPAAWRAISGFAIRQLAVLGGGSALLGESMVRRVQSVANALNAQTFQTTSRNFAEMMSQNMRWLQQQISRGTRIYDIGIDVARKGGGSPFYKAEVAALEKAGYTRQFVKFIEVDGKTYRLHQWVREAK